MGLIRTGPPEDLILKLSQQEPLAAFVETGTCHGETASWASRYFPNVYTIEFSKELFERSRERHASLSNVEFIFGDCRTELPKILARQSGLLLLWLDAHWSGSITYGDGDECPLMQELDILAQTGRESIVFIDDARCFLSPPAHPHRASHWPAIDEICLALRKLPASYVVVFEDVIIAVPERFKALVQKYCQDKVTKQWSERKKESVGLYLKLAWQQFCRKLGFTAAAGS
jgi:hypothetical protein